MSLKKAYRVVTGILGGIVILFAIGGAIYSFATDPGPLVYPPVAVEIEGNGQISTGQLSIEPRFGGIQVPVLALVDCQATLDIQYLDEAGSGLRKSRKASERVDLKGGKEHVVTVSTEEGLVRQASQIVIVIKGDQR